MESAVPPPPLNPGDLVGVAAPGGPVDGEAFDRGLAVLRDMGLRVRTPDPVFVSDGYLAGPDRDRARALMDLFTDRDVRAVICARGGYGTMRILPLLDFDAIRADPKWLVGFSDITALLNVLPVRSGICCLHGPVVTTLGSADPETVTSLREALFGGPTADIEAAAPMVIRPGRAEGILMGGNLATLCHLTGTPWQPDLTDAILLLEDTGEPPYRIDRMLTQMRLAGRLDAPAGIVLGRFGEEAYGEAMEDALVRIFDELFENTAIPVLGGFPVGHGASANLTVPVGRRAILDTHHRRLMFLPRLSSPFAEGGD